MPKVITGKESGTTMVDLSKSHLLGLQLGSPSHWTPEEDVLELSHVSVRKTEGKNGCWQLLVCLNLLHGSMTAVT